MDEHKFQKPSETPSTNRKQISHNDLSTIKNSNSKSFANTSRSNSNSNLTLNAGQRSKSTLTSKDNVTPCGPKKLSSNITLERNGSMPNLSTTGSRMRVDKTTKLRFGYDKYLSSLGHNYSFQVNGKKITSNNNGQKNVFEENADFLKKESAILTEELNIRAKLIIVKKDLDKKIEVLKMLKNSIVFNDSDEEIFSLLISTASKVVLKNFKQMDETDLNAVKVLLNEIIEPLKLIDYENKTYTRILLKDLLIKMAMLTKELDDYSLKCEELFDKQETLQNYNSSMQLLKAQVESQEKSDLTLLLTQSNLFENIKKELNKEE